MARHLIYGQLLDSTLPLTLPLPALEPLPTELLGACRFGRFAGTACQSIEVNWYHHHTLSGDSLPWLSLGRTGAFHIFKFHNGPCFRLQEDLTRIDVYRSEVGDETSDWEIELHFLNQVLPLTLAHRGHSVFHASAIEFPQGTALFLGESGTGKSTLARHLAGTGLRLLTDDCAVLKLDEDPPLVFSGYPAIRIIDDSLETRYRFRGKAFLSPLESPFPFRPEPSPVVAVFQLQPKPNGPIEIEPLSQRDAQFALTRHAFRLDPGDRDRLRSEFEAHSDLARRLPAFNLSYPHDMSLLPALGKSVRDQLGNLGDPCSRIPSPNE
jgi:hypothetical protein